MKVKKGNKPNKKEKRSLFEREHSLHVHEFSEAISCPRKMMLQFFFQSFKQVRVFCSIQMTFFSKDMYWNWYWLFNWLKLQLDHNGLYNIVEKFYVHEYDSCFFFSPYFCGEQYHVGLVVSMRSSFLYSRSSCFLDSQWKTL